MRRWFRFRLRTLFVLVTVTGALSGWILRSQHWIRERQEYLWACRPHVVAVTEQNRALIDLNTLPGDVRNYGAPGGLWLFGERGIGHLNIPLPKSRFQRPTPRPSTYYLDASDPEARRVKSLFPESAVLFFPYAD